MPSNQIAMRRWLGVDDEEVPEWGRKYPNIYGLYGAGRGVVDKVFSGPDEANATFFSEASLVDSSGRVRPGMEGRAADLKRAREMLAKNKDRDTVWRETGWVTGPQGNMLYEVPDNEMRIIESAVNERGKGAVGRFQNTPDYDELVNHDELLKTAPYLKDFPVRYDERSIQGTHAVYDPGARKALVYGTDRPGARGLVAHETQHRIQDEEGRLPAEKVLVDLANPNVARAAMPQMWEATRAAMAAKYATADAGTKEALIKRWAFSRPTLDDALDNLTANRMYKNQAHEMEAYETQYRLPMTAEERRQNTPFYGPKAVEPNQELWIKPPSTPKPTQPARPPMVPVAQQTVESNEQRRRGYLDRLKDMLYGR